MGSFIAVGRALQTIRDQRLYREGHKTFKDYCNDKWGVGRAYANYLIGGSQVAANLATAVALCTPCEIQPIHERQVRPLTILDPAQQCEVWEEAVRSADGKVVTYKRVKALVDELVGPAPEPNPPSASHSGFASSGPLRRTPFAPLTPYPWGDSLRAVVGLWWASAPQIYRSGGRSGGAFQGAGAPGGRGPILPTDARAR
jgi:hypothetical protein